MNRVMELNAECRVSGLGCGVFVGGVNHCSLHCRLAKFREVMYLVKYGAVIGREMRLFVCA